MTHDPLTWDNVIGSEPDFQKAQNDDEFWPPQFAAGYATALRDAVNAVQFRVHDLTNCMKNDDCHILARGADLALSDIQDLSGGSHG